MWLPTKYSNAGGGIAGARRGFKDERLLCAAADGTLACVDSTGRLFAASKVDSCIRSLAIRDDGRAAFGACEDGSIRVWCMSGVGGTLKELFRYPRAHEGACTSLSLSSNLLASGGDDGALRVWRILSEV